MKSTIVLIKDEFGRADKKFFRPSTIKKWVIVVYEGERRFNQDVAQQMATNFVSGARAVGTCCVPLLRHSLMFSYRNDCSGSTTCHHLGEWPGKDRRCKCLNHFSCSCLNYSCFQQLRKAGQTCVQQKKEGPNLIVVILPDGGDDIYTAVKQ